MRRASKIKVITIFLAWLVIFAHSIIPHNHASDNLEECNTLSHKFKAFSENCDRHLKFKDQPEKSHVCHLSDLLFQQFNQDNTFIATAREVHFYPVALIGSVLENRPELFLIPPYYGSSSLRAPPAV